MSEENAVSYEEFCASLHSYVDPDGEDSRDVFMQGYAKEKIRRILELSEIHDLAAMFSGGMAITKPVNMDGFGKITVDTSFVRGRLVFYARCGHGAEAFLRNLYAEGEFTALTQIHELLTLASKDKDIRGLILDGEILALNNPKKKTARRS